MEYDQAFGEIVQFLRHTRQEAHTDRWGNTYLRPVREKRSRVVERAIVNKAEEKRLRKMMKHATASVANK